MNSEKKWFQFLSILAGFAASFFLSVQAGASQKLVLKGTLGFAMSETFQNSSAIASEVECDGVAVEVPPRWYAWAESNKGIKSIKISKTLGREVKTGVIVFLRARVWNENSLEEAKKKYLSNGTHKEVSVEKWKKRTWLLIKDIEGSYLKWTARTITGPHMFKWSVANGPQASQDILLSILKSVSFK